MVSDWFLLLFLLVDLACLGLMAWVGMKMAATGKTTVGKLQPSLQHAQRMAATGQRLATSAKESGTHIYRNARALFSLVRQRVGTVRDLLGELRPPPAQQEEAKELVRAAQTAATGGRQWAEKFSGLRRAAKAAARGRTARSTER